MKARISRVTRGVDNLSRPPSFYRDGPGWPLSGASGGDVVPGEQEFGGITPARNVTASERVKEVLHGAAAAVNHSAEPGSRLWDVIWNPQSHLLADRNLEPPV
jgi:hypothetical protein